MYFTPDGKSAIVVAEARKRLDFRDPKTMALQYSIDAPGCAGINHADFSIDGRYAIFTCEFAGTLAKIDLAERKVRRLPEADDAGDALQGSPGAPRAEPGKVWEPGATEICTVKKGMPQDIRISPDGKPLLHRRHARRRRAHRRRRRRSRRSASSPTGVGAHGLYPSRDGKRLYVANRGSHKIHGSRLRQRRRRR